MKKSANEIIKTKVDELEEENKFQRLVLVDILKIFGNKIDENIQLFEELVYLIEKQNEEYEMLINIKKIQVKNTEIAIETLEKLNNIKNITNQLRESLKLFIELAFILNMNNKILGLFNLNNKSKGFIDEYYNKIVERNKMIKDNIDQDCKILKRKRKGENNE